MEYIKKPETFQAKQFRTWDDVFEVAQFLAPVSRVSLTVCDEDEKYFTTSGAIEIRVNMGDWVVKLSPTHPWFEVVSDEVFRAKYMALRAPYPGRVNVTYFGGGSGGGGTTAGGGGCYD